MVMISRFGPFARLPTQSCQCASQKNLAAPGTQRPKEGGRAEGGKAETCIALAKCAKWAGVVALNSGPSQLECEKCGIRVVFVWYSCGIGSFQ
jgi:hypothetical protein